MACCLQGTMANVIVNTQTLWLLAQDLNKDKKFRRSSESRREWGTRG